MTGHEHLRLHEQILLLALRDERGTTEPRAGMSNLAFAGAILADLALEGRIEIGPDKKAVVHVADPTPLGDPVLDAALTRMQASKPLAAARWIGKLSTLQLRRQAADGLCRRGVLQRTEDKVLFLFTRTRFPTVDPVPERALIESIRGAIETAERVDARLATLIGVAHAAGTLRVLYDRKALKEHGDRIDRLGADSPAAAATLAAVRAVRAAVMVATTTAATTAAISG